MSAFDDTVLADLTAYALDALEADEANELARRLEADPALRRQLASIEEALGDFGTAATTPIEPPPDGRARVVAAVSGAERYAPFVPRLARLFDLTREGMRRVIESTLGRAAWTQTEVPGVAFVHFQAGPRLAGVDTGFVRFDAGAAFPAHRHHGPELTFILEGTLNFSTGETLRPGDEIILDAAHEHAVFAGDRAVVYATFHHGFEIQAGS